MMKYHIVYLTLGGGKFLGQLMTVGLDKLGKEYFDLYNNVDSPWMEREDKFSYKENIDIQCSNSMTFREVAELENLIFINTANAESHSRIQQRNEYVSTSMKNSQVRDLRIKYHDECYAYLKNNKNKFFDFDYQNFWNREHFLQKMNTLGQHFDIDFDTEVLRYAHNRWMNSNLQYRSKKNDG